MSKELIIFFNGNDALALFERIFNPGWFEEAVSIELEVSSKTSKLLSKGGLDVQRSVAFESGSAGQLEAKIDDLAGDEARAVKQDD